MTEEFAAGWLGRRIVTDEPAAVAEELREWFDEEELPRAVDWFRGVADHLEATPNEELARSLERDRWAR